MLKKVMVVDDDPVTCNILRDILENNGYEVVSEESNGSDAIRAYRELRPDVVLMDIVLPDRNGIEATRLILSDDREARVVIISALPDIPLIKAAFASGAIDYIHKPFTAEKILESVRKAL